MDLQNGDEWRVELKSNYEYLDEPFEIADGIVLPVVLIFILLLVNDRNLMQDHTNGPLFNVVAWLTTAVMIVLTVVLLVGTLQA